MAELLELGERELRRAMDLGQILASRIIFRERHQEVAGQRRNCDQLRHQRVHAAAAPIASRLLHAGNECCLFDGIEQCLHAARPSGES